MAVSAVPFALQNGSHPAALFRQALSSVIPNSGGIVQPNDLAVTQTGTPSMAVVVGIGRAWVPGTNIANPSGFNYNSQAQYFAFNDANVTLTIATADPTNPRIDIVCLTINDAFYTGTVNNAVLQVITGTPAASPSAPVAPANSLILATVNVAALAASVSNSNITIPAIPLAGAATGYVGTTQYTNGGTFSGATEQLLISTNAIVTSGRTYKITAQVAASSNINNTYTNYRVKHGSTGGITGTADAQLTKLYTGNGLGEGIEFSGIFTATTTGVTTCILTGQNVTQTTATITFLSGTPSTLWIRVEDMGY